MCFRHSPISDIKSIMKNGLDPDKSKSNLRQYTADERQKVFYSEGMEGVITFDCTCQRKYKQMQEQGKVPSNITMDEFYREQDKEERVYLMFDGYGVINEQEDNSDRFADAYTSNRIPADKIKVCVLSNSKTGEISFKREDIIRYMKIICSIDDIKGKYQLDDRLEEQLAQYYEDTNIGTNEFADFELQEIGIEEFYKYYVLYEHQREILENGTIDNDFIENKFIEISKKILSRDNQADFSFILHGVCGIDLSEIDMSNLSEDNFRRLTFDSETKFPEDKALMPSFIKELIEQGKFNSFSEYANSLIEQGKDFSNTEQLHTQEFDGRGTTIGLIDGCFDSSAKEFEGRVKRHLVFKEVDGEIVCEDYEKKDGDNYHGKTTASLAVGEEYGVAPKADMYLFGIAEGTDWTKAKEAILKYIIDNNIELDIISMSADKQNIGKASEYIEMLEKKGCTLFDSKKYWMNFVWGRLDNNGEALLDHLMQTMRDTDMQYDENDRKIINNIPNNIVLPCTQRTSFSQSDKDGKQTYKYNGSFCGASFAIPQIAGLFLLARQADKSISFDKFIEIARDTTKINKDNMKYLDAKGIIEKVKDKTHGDGDGSVEEHGNISVEEHRNRPVKESENSSNDLTKKHSLDEFYDIAIGDRSEATNEVTRETTQGVRTENELEQEHKSVEVK